MAYKVCISTGKGKNLSRACSTPLPNKKRVVGWVKRTPIGNNSTQVSVENTRTGKVLTGRKIRFFNSSRF